MNATISPILWALAAVAWMSVPATAVASAAPGHPLLLAQAGYGSAQGAEGSGTTASGEKNIKITAPADGARISAGTPVVLSYDATLVSPAKHLNVYVDDRFVGLTHVLKGEFDVGTLAPGTHTICIKEAMHGLRIRDLIGVDRCITVTVK